MRAPCCRQAARRFTRGQEGAVAVWFALLLVPMLGFTYAAIEYTELSEERTNMIDAMDASALAIARWIKLNGKDPCEVATGTSSADVADREAAKRYGREFFARNYRQATTLFADQTMSTAFDPSQHVKFNLNCSTITVTADAYSDMGGVLRDYFGVPPVEMGVSAEITLPGSGKVEIAVVVDVSGSMSATDMSRFRSAMGAMSDELFGLDANATNDNVRIGVVPFNSVVNVGASVAAANPGWFDHAAAAPFHGANFIDVRYQTGASEQARFLTASEQVSHFALFNSVPGVSWDGCVEARPYPLDEVPDEPGTAMDAMRYNLVTGGKPSGFSKNASAASGVKNRIDAAWFGMPSMSSSHKNALNDAAASRYVPWFYPDEADCDQMANTERCRTNHPTDERNDVDPADDEGLSIPSWLSGYGDSWWSLLDNPTRGTSYDASDYRNRHFIRDALYIDVLRSEDSAARAYNRFTLEYRNAHGPLGGGDKRKNFEDPAQTDYADFRNAAARLGVTDVGDHEYRLRQGYVGVWNPTTKTYEGKYDLYDSAKASGDGPNYRCGPALLRLTSQRKTLMDYVNALGSDGGTNSAMGMLWGWNMLTPKEPLSGAVDLAQGNNATEWRKFVILMSDGKNNVNERDNHMLTTRNAYGYGYEDRLQIVSDTTPNSGQIAAAYDLEMDHKTIRICNRMEAEGIKVFTVGYGLDQVTDNNERNAIENMLKACSNSADGTQIIGSDGNPTGVTYVRADNEAALQKAFRDITDAIEELHISG